MNEFKTYHPIVNFTYFLCVIGFSMFLMHPVSLVISLLSALLYLMILKGKRAAITKLAALIPIAILTAVINSLFNHEGVTVLIYLPSDNPLTAEALLFGCSAAVMIACVIYHFSCYNEVVTSDKFIYLFGKIIPALSLVLSMVLHFVPKLIKRLKEIVTAQKCIGRDISKGSLWQRMKLAVKILSILVTWSLENSVETADSMKSRGYGLSGRTAYSIFHFDKRDYMALFWILITSAAVIAGKLYGFLYCRYFPSFAMEWTTSESIATQIAYLLLCFTPIIIEIRGSYRWNSIK